jgi:hypothetical protein
MNTVYCYIHNVCLCSNTYTIRGDLAILVCPHLDWNCWRKYHEWYLPKGLFNDKGHIKRSSKLHIARKLIMDHNPSTGNFVTTSIEIDSNSLSSPIGISGTTPASSNTTPSDRSISSSQRSGSPHSSRSISSSSFICPRELSPIPTPSPPTLQGCPFDGESENARIDEDAVADDETPFSPEMSLAFLSSSSPSTDFGN